MEVFPAQLVIPPHESRYTTVRFAPRAIQQYNGILEAVVEGGTDPKTKSFSVELRGEGTLPSLTLVVGGPGVYCVCNACFMKDADLPLSVVCVASASTGAHNI
jgi:hypothetical protein